jgi:polysaccharide export outer membrane protein
MVMSFQRALVVALLVAWAFGITPALAQTPSPAAAAPGPAAAPPAPAPSVPTGAPTGSVDPNEYRIGPEDVLQISVWKNEAISRTVPVRPDGKVTLPLLNDVVAAGFTPMQFRDLLTQKLAEYMPTPEVSVIVIDARSFKVSVMGEVPKPGRYELRSRTTVLDMIALSGGLNQFASRTKIFVLRPDGAAQKRLPFNYNKAVAAGGEQENFYLQGGDILVVP